ncbi:MAG TPA: signal peptide peptidase SppA, partial [Candidatus Kapabacteria bacterium]|nr:signal peptide peptidase SppA [Candidatus Kapabacteria bacterium]
MSFFKVFFASVLGFFVSLTLIVLLAIGTIAAIVASVDREQQVDVEAASVLVLDLSKDFPEYRTSEGLRELAGGRASITAREVIAALEEAAGDSRIAGLRIEASGRPGSWAIAEELRRGVESFRSRGKFVIATVGHGGVSEGGYFVASAAESIIAVPGASIEMNGIAAVLPFFTPALDRLGIDAQVVRAGSFKSAVEPFILDSASAETQAMTRELVTSTFSRFRSVVAPARKLSADQLSGILSTRGLMTAHEAQSAGLLDAVLYEDQIDSVLRARTKREADDDIETISIAEYATAALDGETSGPTTDAIALVYAVGEIRAGRSSSGGGVIAGGNILGDETFAEAMKTARESKTVKAVVVRIDSPGGEAGPSEAMWREIRLTAAEKPVIASMGSVAASGGYFMAAACDSIVAEATTVTGSIGVFGLWFTIREFLNETIGVNVQVIRSDSLADMGSMLRAPTALEQAILQRTVDTVYRKFLTIVSEGRGITLAQADSIGQGRVYTGARARELKLVDEIGGLGRAIEMAAARAGLEPDGYRLRVLPRRRSFLESFSEMFDETSVMAMLGWQTDPLAAIRSELDGRTGVQMLGP